MDSYLEIKKFDKCSKQEWNAFCDNSDDVWLWHHYDSIVAKSLWSNLENNSFIVIDNSNKKQIVLIFPFFLEKKKKLIDYSSFESTGGPAFINDISENKKQKIFHFVNNYIIQPTKTLLQNNNCIILVLHSQNVYWLLQCFSWDGDSFVSD